MLFPQSSKSERKNECKAINKSLLSLGNAINELAKGHPVRTSPVPPSVLSPSDSMAVVAGW